VVVYEMCVMECNTVGMSQSESSVTKLKMNSIQSADMKFQPLISMCKLRSEIEALRGLCLIFLLLFVWIITTIETIVISCNKFY